MSELERVRKQLAEYENRDITNGRPRFLFRGQSTIYPSIKSSYGRVPNSEVEIRQAQRVYIWARSICQGLRGYTIDPLEGVAVLQHYGWPTPLIDLTGTLEIACFFALRGASAGSRSVIYVVDTSQITEQGLIVDHSFLTHTLDDGGLRHRWLRQDGFAVTTRDWRASPDARKFDLLAAPFRGALQAHEFTVADSDRIESADVLSTAGDPIPQHLQNLLRIFCNETFEGTLAPKLAAIIDGMWNANAK